MTEYNFEYLKEIISTRRTTKPASMNGKIIPESQVESLLALADWAPTHGRTEPWRFFIYTGESLAEFGKTHAALYMQHMPEDKRNADSHQKLLHAVDRASHLIVAAMKRGANPKIPALEEICATSAAIQNLLLGATALGIASMWNSGGMTHSHALKSHLGLGAEDLVLGLIYLGYTDEPAKEGKRTTPTEEKMKWM